MSKYSEKLKQVLKVGDVVSVPKSLGYGGPASKERITGMVEAISDDQEHVDVKMLDGADTGNVVKYSIGWLKLELKK